MANLIVEMGGEAVEDEEGTVEDEDSAGSVSHLAVGVPHVRSVNDQGQTNIRPWRLGSRSPVGGSSTTRAVRLAA